MMEVHITISTPDLAGAICALAEAISTSTPATAPAARTPRTRKKAAVENPVSDPAPVPVQETPTAPPVTSTPAPETSAPVTAAVNPVTGESVNTAPVNTHTERVYTMDELANAGAALLDRGLMEQLMAVLGKFGVQIITQIQPSQYAALAAELRALGADI